MPLAKPKFNPNTPKVVRMPFRFMSKPYSVGDAFPPKGVEVKTHHLKVLYGANKIWDVDEAIRHGKMDKPKKQSKPKAKSKAKGEPKAKPAPKAKAKDKPAETDEPTGSKKPWE